MSPSKSVAECVNDPAKECVNNRVKESVKEPVEESNEESDKESVKESIKESVEIRGTDVNATKSTCFGCRLERERERISQSEQLDEEKASFLAAAPVGDEVL